MVSQGEIYWIDFGEPSGSAPAFVRPAVVVQSDALNRSRMRTTMVCPLTSQLRRARIPGNVRVRPDEAGLPEESVVLVSQVMTVNKQDLHQFVGRLPRARLAEVLSGIILSLGVP
ncbi:MAG: type II toxin-antitoxin system PemK/MazF family toxin [Hyphomicrobiales bacterium]